MNPDTNWKEVRATAEDLSELMKGEVSPKFIENLLKMLEDLILHRFIEYLSDTEDYKDMHKKVRIELPYLGCLVASPTTRKNVLSVSFVPRKSFYKKLVKAYNSLESPLLDHLEEELEVQLVQSFEEGKFDE